MKISISAIPLRPVKSYLKLGWDKTRYSDIFNKYEHSRNAYRIYIPLGHNVQAVKVRPPLAVVKELEKYGYVVDDYMARVAIKTNGDTRKKRIGSIIKDPEVKAVFDNDPQLAGSKSVKQWVVISRHPYDILGMSFDRGWTSCMDLQQGSNAHYLKEDIKHGTIVAYLIKDLDKNINNPTARVLIKPFVHDLTKEVKLLPLGLSTVYGTAPTSFYSTVVKFCDAINVGKPKGKYVLHPALYLDDYNGAEVSSFIHFDIDMEEFSANVENNKSNYVLKILGSDTPLDCLKILRKSKMWSSNAIQALVAKSNNISEEIALDILKNKDPSSFYALAQNVAITDVVVDEMLKIFKGLKSTKLKFSMNEVIKTLAINPFTPSTSLVEMYDDFPMCRFALCDNPNMPRSVFQRIFDSNNNDLICSAIEHPRIPIDFLERAYESGSFQVKREVLHNPRTPISILTKAVNSEDLNLLKVLATSTNLDLTTQLILAGKNNVGIKTLLATNSKLKSECIDILLKSKSSKVLKELSRNPALSSDQVDKLYEVVVKLLNKPDLATLVVEVLQYIVNALVKHPKLTKHTLSKVLTNKVDIIRSIGYSSPKITLSQALLVLDDTFEAKRMAVFNRVVSEEVLVKLADNADADFLLLLVDAFNCTPNLLSVIYTKSKSIKNKRAREAILKRIVTSSQAFIDLVLDILKLRNVAVAIAYVKSLDRSVEGLMYVLLNYRNEDIQLAILNTSTFKRNLRYFIPTVYPKLTDLSKTVVFKDYYPSIPWDLKLEAIKTEKSSEVKLAILEKSHKFKNTEDFSEIAHIALTDSDPKVVDLAKSLLKE